tara:strand:- start:234 stop:1274 length:1041 start_codon:yes stop_codon:yes gene_type:complete
MQAIRFEHQGPPEVLHLCELPDPVPGPGQVLLEVHAASVNHLDIWVRRELPGVQLPRIPGADAAGMVCAVGEGVSSPGPGTRVLLNPGYGCGSCARCDEGETSLCRRYHILGESGDGTYCSKLVVAAEQCLPVPQDWSFEEAAAFPLVAITSWRMCVTRGALRAGEKVLILGASGGVGAMCVQLARHRGCQVIATASTEEKLALCRRLGAEYTVNYSDSDWPRRVRELAGRGGVDVTIDCVGKATWQQSLRLTRAGGRILTCGATTGHDPVEDLRHIFFRQLSVIGSTMGSRQDLEAALAVAAQGEISPVIHRVLPLSQAARAHQLIEDRAVLGKIVLVPDPLLEA